VLFDKLASVYILFEKYIYILALKIASPCDAAVLKGSLTSIKCCKSVMLSGRKGMLNIFVHAAVDSNLFVYLVY